MLTKIHIQGYKCLKNAEIATANLNIFAGPNSSGKSSTIQMLLLLRQSATEQRRISSLSLTGELYEGGTATDVLHPESSYKVQCNLTSETNSFAYQFEWVRGDEGNSHVRSLSALPNSCGELLPELAGPDFIYLNAERSRPRVFFEIPPDRVGLAGKLGKHGEYTSARLARASVGINVVDWNNESIGLQQRLKSAPKLLDQLEFSDELIKSEGRIDLLTKQMLSWIMPGAYFDVTENERTDSAVLDYVRDRNQTSAKVRPTHMGFGLTYALPVIASGFLTPPGGLIIVENPEAHLHPYSQSRLGVLLAMIAASKRQVFVETHSDHFVNGVRVAIAQKLISSNNLKIHFFRPPIQGTTSDIVSIDCDERGRMSKWPDGFFDQIENDLSKI
jgi:predicted ATPase